MMLQTDHHINLMPEASSNLYQQPFAHSTAPSRDYVAGDNRNFSTPLMGLINESNPPATVNPSQPVSQLPTSPHYGTLHRMSQASCHEMQPQYPMPQHHYFTTPDSPQTTPPQLYGINGASAIGRANTTTTNFGISPPLSPNGQFRLNSHTEQIQQFIDVGEYMANSHNMHLQDNPLYGQIPQFTYGSTMGGNAAAYGLGLSALDDDDDDPFDPDDLMSEIPSPASATIATPIPSLVSTSTDSSSSSGSRRHNSVNSNLPGGMVGSNVSSLSRANSDAASVITTASSSTTSTASSHEPYKCGCNKVFEKASQLRAHAKIHSCRERSFLCEHCEKAFLRGRDLRRHSVIHQEDFVPYICENCKTTFTRSDALHRHIKARRCKTG